MAAALLLRKKERAGADWVRAPPDKPARGCANNLSHRLSSINDLMGHFSDINAGGRKIPPPSSAVRLLKCIADNQAKERSITDLDYSLMRILIPAQLC
jgi:hypothetical protein